MVYNIRYVLTLNHCIQGLQTCNLDLVLKFVLIECHTVEHHHQIHNLERKYFNDS